MTAIAFLLGLLILAAIGSTLFGSRSSGYGLPSGTEYLLLGFAIGPEGFSLVNESTISAFDPLTTVGLGWLALIIGLRYVSAGRPGRWRRMAGSLVLSCISVVLAFFVLWLVQDRLVVIPAEDQLLLWAGMSLLCCETTRHAVQWGIDRYSAAGPLGECLSDIAEGDDAAPIIGLAIVFAIEPSAARAVPLHPALWVAVTLGVGIILGVTSAALLRGERKHGEQWSVILGAGLLVIGASTRLGLSSLTAMFAMGAALALSSRQAAAVRSSIGKTEHAVLLPILLLAGTKLSFAFSSQWIWLLVAVVLLRVVASVFRGLVLYAVSSSCRRAGPLVGLALTSSGAVTLAVGLACAVRFPGEAGALIFATAAIINLVGELIGPWALYRGLRRAGETRGVGSAPDPSEASASSAHGAAR